MGFILEEYKSNQGATTQQSEGYSEHAKIKTAKDVKQASIKLIEQVYSGRGNIHKGELENSLGSSFKQAATDMDLS